jgi:AcrR family transcriptional regulator
MAAKSQDRKGAILSHAEELFANFGLHGVSIRDIAEAAAVPPALVLYHFSTKDNLYQEVFESRARDFNSSRERALRALAEGPGQPEIEEVLHAMAKPWFDVRRMRGGVSYARLIAREVSDPDEGSRGIIAKTLDPIAKHFFGALHAARGSRRRALGRPLFHCRAADDDGGHGPHPAPLGQVLQGGPLQRTANHQVFRGSLAQCRGDEWPQIAA